MQQYRVLDQEFASWNDAMVCACNEANVSGYAVDVFQRTTIGGWQIIGTVPPGT